MTRWQQDSYRALGRYFVVFSTFVGTMRTILEERIAGDPGPEYELITLALSGLEAQRVADAFFAMCRTLGGLDKDGRAVEKQLRRMVDAEIRRRNIMAHGSWNIPTSWWKTPVLSRTKASSIDNPFQASDISVAELDNHSAELEILTALIYDFAATCTNLWAYMWTDEGEQAPSLPTANEAFMLVDGQVVYRRIPNHPLAAIWAG